jgi:hypothetical protein
MDTNFTARVLYSLPMFFTSFRNDSLSKLGCVAGEALEGIGGVVYMKRKRSGCSEELEVDLTVDQRWV